MIAFIHCELTWINRIWLRYRALDEQPASSKPGDAARRRVLYRAAVREAQRAITTLGADADFAHFVEAGARFQPDPAIRNACTAIKEIAALELDLEPDPEWFGAEPDPLLCERVPPAPRPCVAIVTRRP